MIPIQPSGRVQKTTEKKNEHFVYRQTETMKGNLFE